MRSTLRLIPLPLLALLLAAPVACSGSGTQSAPPTTSTASSEATTTETTAEAGATTAVPESTSAASTKVSANTATNEQLVAALTAAGVTNAARWAREIEEYRPYDENDPNLTKLRQNLQKYNPGTDTMNKIIAALEP